MSLKLTTLRKVILSLLVAGGMLLVSGQGNEARADCGGSPNKYVVVCSGKKQATFVGLLDQLGVSAAYASSVRCLATAWQGKHVVNVRRASDSAASDINCLSGTGNFDAATFNTFCNSTTCFVAKWYDQSGNTRDASQATAASQPQMLLNQTNGKPALIFVSANSVKLVTASFASSTSPQAVNAISNRTTVGTGIGSFSMGLGGNGNLFGYPNSANKAYQLGGTSGSVTSTASDGAFHSITYVMNGASSLNNVDGAENAGTSTVLVQSGVLTIGGYTGGGLLDGSVSEAIDFGATIPSSSQRTTLHTNQSAYYGTP